MSPGRGTSRTQSCLKHLRPGSERPLGEGTPAPGDVAVPGDPLPAFPDGVLAYPLQQPSDAVLSLMAHVIALTPGTMTVEATSDPPVLYVHFLLLDDIEKARRTVAGLERLAVAASVAPGRRAMTREQRPEEALTTAALVMLALAAMCFTSAGNRPVARRPRHRPQRAHPGRHGGHRPHAAHTGNGAILPALVALALVGPVSNGMTARFIEGRG